MGTTFLAVVRAVSFEAMSLTSRLLQEKGFAPTATFRLQGYAIGLGLIWSAIFVRPADVSFILHRPTLLVYMLLIPLLWNTSEFLYHFVLNTTSSMSVLSTLYSVTVLPLLLIVGTFFNHDTPSLLSVVAT